MSTFSIRLRELRQDLQLTQSELGEKFGMSKSGISSYEVRGRFPDEELLRNFATLFGVSISYLIGTSDVRNEITDTKDNGFTIQLVNRLLKENIISDPNNIDPSIIEMVISSLRADLKKKRD